MFIKRIIIFLVICLTGIWIANAQTKQISLRGTVLEKGTDEPVEQATVQLLSLSDSTFVAGAVTLANGDFSLRARAGKYLLKISFVGFRPYWQDIQLSSSHPVLQLGTIRLIPDAILLDEAVVLAEAPPVTVRADTIEYNASAYRTPEGAMLEELVKKLPGAEVDNDGNITINGKEVKKIMVDGKEFFSDDPKVSMKNLPVNMVEKVKAYDKKSDTSRLTGIDDGEEETVLDLTVKKGMKKGWIGNLIAGYGSERRYEIGTMLSRFRDDASLSVIGSLNNTNNQGFSEFGDAGQGLGSGGAGSGVTSAKSLGLNYAQNKEDLRMSGNVQYGYSDNDARRKSSTETFIGDQSSFSHTRYNSRRKRHDVRADFRLEWRPDSVSTLIFRPHVRYSHTGSQNENFLETLNNERMRINNGKSHASGLSNNYSMNGRLQYFRRLNNKGRNLALSAHAGWNDASTDSESLAQTTFYKYDAEGNLVKDSLDIRDRNTDRDNNSLNYTLSASYTEPIFKKHYLQLRYEFTYRDSKAQSLVSNQNYDPAGVGMGYVYADSLSNRVMNNYQEHRIDLSLQGVYSKMMYNIGVGLTPQSSESETTIGPNSNRPVLKQNVVNFAPSLMFRYMFTKQHILMLHYRGRSDQPDIESLQEIIDNTDPLDLRYGNPNLKPSFNNSFSLYYNKFVPDAMRSYSLNLFYTSTVNSVANKMYYNVETGGKETHKVNVNGNWSGRGYFSFNTPFRNKKFILSSNSNLSFSDAVSYVSVSREEEAVLSTTHSFAAAERLTVSYRSDAFDVSVNASVDYNLTRNGEQKNGNRQSFDYFLGGNTNINLPWELYLSTDLNYRIKRGYSGGFNEDEILWNAQLSKNFLKNKATIRVKMYDILQRQSNLNRTVSETMISDTEYNTLGSYVMVHFVYRLNTLGSKGNRSKNAARPSGKRQQGGMIRRNMRLN